MEQKLDRMCENTEADGGSGEVGVKVRQLETVRKSRDTWCINGV